MVIHSARHIHALGQVVLFATQDADILLAAVDMEHHAAWQETLKKRVVPSVRTVPDTVADGHGGRAGRHTMPHDRREFGALVQCGLPIPVGVVVVPIHLVVVATHMSA